MTREYNTENNKQQSEYHKIAEKHVIDWLEFVQPAEGDFLILKRQSNNSLNYVIHKGKLRFIGEY